MLARGRRLAFDYGDVRIGVAVCDADGILSSPLVTLETKNPGLINEIAKIIEEYDPIQIFVGKPEHLSGTPSESSMRAERFGELLNSSFSVDISFVDERLSTVSAQSQLRSAGVNSKDSKGIIDQMAAVQILEQGLAVEKNL